MFRQTVSHLILVAMVTFAGLSCGQNARVPEPQMSTQATTDAAAAPATARPAERAQGIAGAAGKAFADAPPSSSNAAPTVTLPTMVIRNGTVSIEVDSLEPAIAAVQQVATALGGYVGNTSLEGGAYTVRKAVIQLKIPSARYENALSSLRPIGKIESINSTSEDVGEEFVDVTARQANAHRLEERLIGLLATRTGKLEDVLMVERELARVREEIERYEGRLRYIKSRVATSTLEVTVHEKAPVIADSPGENVIGNAFKDAWRNFVHFVAWFISSLGLIVPFLVLLAIAYAAWRRFGPALRKKAP